MAKKKLYYAVRKGHNPGIYQSWEECKHQVSGFPNNEYKGFSNLDEAEEYLISSTSGHCRNESYEGSKLSKEIKVQPSTSKFLSQVKNDNNITYGKGPLFENTCLKSSHCSVAEAGECLDYISLETIQHELDDHERQYITFSSFSELCNLLSNNLNCAGDMSELHAPIFLLHKGTTLERHGSPIQNDDDSELLHFASESHLFSYLGLRRPEAPATKVAVRYFHELYKLEFAGVYDRKFCKAGAAILLRLPNDSVALELMMGLGVVAGEIAEFHAFILGLKTCLERGIYRIEIIGEFKGINRWKCQFSDQYMMNLAKEADNLMNTFKIIWVKHIENASNFHASSLANRAFHLPVSINPIYTFLGEVITIKQGTGGRGVGGGIMESRRMWMWSLSAMRRFLSTAAPAAQQGGEEVVKKTKSARKKKKTLFEVAKFLPDWGVGCNLAKSHWEPNFFYKITRINLYKDGRHGKAWGIFHKNGVPSTETPNKIGGVNKRGWRYVENLLEKTTKTEVKSTMGL